MEIKVGNTYVFQRQTNDEKLIMKVVPPWEDTPDECTQTQVVSFNEGQVGMIFNASMVTEGAFHREATEEEIELFNRHWNNRG